MNLPLLCRLFGHRYDHTYVYGNEAAGHVIVMCRRPNCGHIAKQYFESREPTATPGTF